MAHSGHNVANTASPKSEALLKFYYEKRMDTEFMNTSTIAPFVLEELSHRVASAQYFQEIQALLLYQGTSTYCHTFHYVAVSVWVLNLFNYNADFSPK